VGKIGGGERVFFSFLFRTLIGFFFSLCICSERRLTRAFLPLHSVPLPSPPSPFLDHTRRGASFFPPLFIGFLSPPFLAIPEYTTLHRECFPSSSPFFLGGPSPFSFADRSPLPFPFLSTASPFFFFMRNVGAYNSALPFLFFVDTSFFLPLSGQKPPPKSGWDVAPLFFPIFSQRLLLPPSEKAGIIPHSFFFFVSQASATILAFFFSAQPTGWESTLPFLFYRLLSFFLRGSRPPTLLFFLLFERRGQGEKRRFPPSPFFPLPVALIRFLFFLHDRRAHGTDTSLPSFFFSFLHSFHPARSFLFFLQTISLDIRRVRAQWISSSFLCSLFFSPPLTASRKGACGPFLFFPHF